MTGTPINNTERFGIIDIGTNSVRLLIADFFYREKSFNVIKTDRAVTRLGEGLYDDFIIKEKAIVSTLQAIKVFVDIISSENCDNIYCFATSAVRDSRNSNELISRVKNETGVDINVISGEKEALFSALGASIGISERNLNIVDIGGGSTEIIFMEPGNLSKVSLNIGCVRLKELFHSSNDAAEYVRNILSSCKIPLNKDAITVFTGGTADNLSDIVAYNTELFDYNKTLVSIDDIKQLYEKVYPLSIQERKAFLLRLDPTRADIIDYGLLIIIELAEKFKFNSILLKKSSNLEGALIHIASQKNTNR
ncbi:MAG: hypothetical protein E7315_03035 [Clostridiales bacterium]|nr:hypothetical protein [Clostridiales bacterium]